MNIVSASEDPSLAETQMKKWDNIGIYWYLEASEKFSLKLLMFISDDGRKVNLCIAYCHK